jgi:hypothetical protein
MKYTSMAVFCGSKSGQNPLFVEQAIQLGHLLADNNIQLIYGGGNKGLMAATANGVLEKNGTVIGIIPEVLKEWEHQHEGITELIVVENMHLRKHLLYDKCDAAIILPGGYGTLDELFEILTWNQLKIHHKPIFLLNSGGFYDHLILHIKKMEQELFLYTSLEECIKIVNTPEEIFHF